MTQGRIFFGGTMSEGKGAKEPTSVPPSFIPSSGRKKTMPSTDSSRSQSAPSQPASFAPAKRSDHASSVKPAKRTARPSSSVPQSFQPAARATSETRRNPSSSPVSFAPEIPARPIQRSSSGGHPPSPRRSDLFHPLQRRLPCQKEDLASDVSSFPFSLY